MLRWNVGNILNYAMLLVSFVVMYLAGRPGSIIFKLFFKEEQKPSEKTLKMLRMLGVIGFILFVIFVIGSIVIYFAGNK